VRKVFPELRRRCRLRQVELVEVDLRWGITEQEAQQGKVLPICLAEIDRARPFFMGLLGERYGWVPEKNQYDLSLIVEQPWLEEHRGGKSVTELEILHGVLNNPAMKNRAFFYLRDPRWAEKRGGAYLGEGPTEKAKLAELKAQIRQSGFPVVENYPNPEALAERVQQDLWKLIDEAYPESEVPDALALERRRHEAYAATRMGLYLGGEKYFNVLDRAMRAEPFIPVLVTGQSGGGKSALLANWVERYRQAHPETGVIVHHLGSGADAADPVKMVVRLMQEIARITGDDLQLERDAEKQLQQLPMQLATASAWAERTQGELLFVLDGLDKVSDRKNLIWFPSIMPAGIKMVASCLEGEILKAAVGKLEWQTLMIEPFSNEEQATFIREYLGRYRKALTPEQTRALQRFPLSGNPLFLLTVLEELRVFGVHEELEERLRILLSPPPSKNPGEELTVDDVFEHVLARLEKDLGQQAVQKALEAIWASRSGLYQEELLALAELAPVQWAEIHNALDESLYESSGKINFGHDYLRKAVEDRYGLVGNTRRRLHKRIAEWFERRDIDARVAEELPWQWERAEDLKRLNKVLTNKALFNELIARDKYELLGFWLRQGQINLEKVYCKAWRFWQDNADNHSTIAATLSDFLSEAGYFGSFTESIFRHGLLRHAKKTAQDKQKFLRLGNNFAAYLADKGDIAGSLKLHQEILKSRRKLLGGSHPETLGSINNLGIVYKKRGDLRKAKIFFEKALKGFENSLGYNHSATLKAVGNLAGILDLKGRPAKAETLYQRALEGERHNHGSFHPATLLAMNNLASFYEEMGKVDLAEKLNSTALGNYFEVVGSNHPETLRCLKNSGHIKLTLGEYDEAEAIFSQVLKSYKEFRPPDHSDILDSLSSLGITCEHKGDYKQAGTYHSECLRRAKRSLGSSHPSALQALNNLANVFLKQGSFKHCEKLYREAIRIYTRYYGEDSPDTLASISNLAVLLNSVGKYKEAKLFCNRAFKGRSRILGPSHPDTLSTMGNLANIYRAKGNLKEAESLYRQTLAARSRVLGLKHPDTLLSFSNLGAVLSETGNFKEAEQLYLHALLGRRKTLGQKHPDTLGSILNLANLFTAKEDFRKAERLYQKALKGFLDVLGGQHPDTLLAMYNMANFYKDLGKRDQALGLARKAFKGRTVLYGLTHPESLTTAKVFISLLRDLGSYKEAKKLSIKIFNQLKKENGIKDFNAIYYANNIGILSTRLKDYKGAVKIFSQVLKVLQQLHGLSSIQALTVANNLASSLNQYGDRKAAISLLRSCANLSRGAEDKVRYNLACFECLDGNAKKAFQLIAKHLKRHPDQKAHALEDQDLAIIRDQILALVN